MIPSLMAGLNEKNVQAVVDKFNLNDYYFPTIFPLKQTKFLTWKTLKTKVGLRVAADLVSRGARLSQKARNAIKRIEGDIPKIAIERKMDEEELTEYQTLLELAKTDADQIALVEAWADDLEFCWTGLASRVEWMALHEMSHGGKLRVSSENNAHVISYNDADYEIPAANKRGATVDWHNAATAKPFSVDLKNLIKESRKSVNGSLRLKHAWISTNTFNQLVETEECQKLCASYVANALNMQTVPGITEVNALCQKLPYLYGLQFHVIDQDITVEFENGDQISGNPFADNVICLTENAVLGNTFWVTPVGMTLKGSSAIKVMRSFGMLKKFANEDPEEEVTQGIANAFPAWAGAERAFFLDTKNSTWSEGA